MAMKNPVGKGAWMAGLVMSGLSLILAILGVALNLLGFAVAAANVPPPAAGPNWNPPVQPIAPRPAPPNPNFPLRK